MYNLFVSGYEKDSWAGEPFIFDELPRRVFAYTDIVIANRLSSFDNASVSEIKKYPCIFAYESCLRRSPKFGFIRNIDKRQGKVRIEYEILPVDPFLSFEDLEKMSFELDINIKGCELYRTHWAVKDVDLAKELGPKGIVLPAREQTKPIDITTHRFDVALSFSGNERSFVGEIASEIVKRLGQDSCFYDEFYHSQLAQPSLDSILEGIYRNQSNLLVAFLSESYEKKPWCGIEFRVIKEILLNRGNKKVMYIKMDDSDSSIVLKTDGYIDARRFTPEKIAQFICERVDVLRNQEESESLV